MGCSWLARSLVNLVTWASPQASPTHEATSSNVESSDSGETKSSSWCQDDSGDWHGLEEKQSHIRARRWADEAPVSASAWQDELRASCSSLRPSRKRRAGRLGPRMCCFPLPGGGGPRRVADGCGRVRTSTTSGPSQPFWPLTVGSPTRRAHARKSANLFVCSMRCCVWVCVFRCVSVSWVWLRCPMRMRRRGHG